MHTHWTNDHRKWYREVYLKSDHWHELRSRKLKQNPKCERCPARACDVHHVNYRNIFDVQLSDLLSLCRPCHEREHKVNGMPKRERLLDTRFPDRVAQIITHRKRIEAKKNRYLYKYFGFGKVWTKEEKKMYLDRIRKKKARRGPASNLQT